MAPSTGIGKNFQKKAGHAGEGGIDKRRLEVSKEYPV
jgi:hypothetical protein